MLCRPAMDAYNFPEKCKSIVFDLPLDQVHSLGIGQECADNSEVNDSVNNSSTTERVDLNSGSTDVTIGSESSTAAPSEGSCVDTSTRPSGLEAPTSDGSTREKGPVEGDSTNGADSSLTLDPQVSSLSCELSIYNFSSRHVWLVVILNYEALKGHNSCCVASCRGEMTSNNLSQYAKFYFAVPRVGCCLGYKSVTVTFSMCVVLTNRQKESVY